jgi:hypothetical protein
MSCHPHNFVRTSEDPPKWECTNCHHDSDVFGITGRLPFSYVNDQVDKLYEKKIDPKDTAAIDEHCAFIASYINSCGWTEEQFIRGMFGLPILEDMN